MAFLLEVPGDGFVSNDRGVRPLVFDPVEHGLRRILARLAAFPIESIKSRFRTFTRSRIHSKQSSGLDPARQSRRLKKVCDGLRQHRRDRRCQGTVAEVRRLYPS